MKTAKTLEDALNKFNVIGKSKVSPSNESPGNTRSTPHLDALPLLSLSPSPSLNPHNPSASPSPSAQTHINNDLGKPPLPKVTKTQPSSSPSPSPPEPSVDSSPSVQNQGMTMPRAPPIFCEDEDEDKDDKYNQNANDKKHTAQEERAIAETAVIKIQALVRGVSLRNITSQEVTNNSIILDYEEFIPTSPADTQRIFDEAISDDVRIALLGRNLEQAAAATKIQAIARRFLVRKFDQVAMTKVIDYLKAHQALNDINPEDGLADYETDDGLDIHGQDDHRKSSQNDDNDDDDDNDNSDDEQHDEDEDEDEDSIPEPKEEELDMAWSILQKNRNLQAIASNESNEVLPREPIKVRELLSTWDWLKAKQRSRQQEIARKAIKSTEQQQQQQQHPSLTQELPVETISPDIHSENVQPSSTACKPSISHLEDTPEDSQGDGLDTNKTTTEIKNAQIAATSNSSDTSALHHKSSENLQLHSSRYIDEFTIPSPLSCSTPPRIGDLVAFYTWLEQNRLYHGILNTSSKPRSYRNAAAEIQQAREESKQIEFTYIPPSSSAPIVEPVDDSMIETAAEIGGQKSVLEPSDRYSISSVQQGEEKVSYEPSQPSSPHSAPSTPELVERDSAAIEQGWSLEKEASMLHETQSSGRAFTSSSSTSPTVAGERTFSAKTNAQIDDVLITTTSQVQSKLDLKSSDTKAVELPTDDHDDLQHSQSREETLQKAKSIVRTGKVNFDEVFELWTWLEMNDFDMTKFKRRAVEMGIVDDSYMESKIRAEKRKAEKLVNPWDRASQSEEGLPPPSRTQSNIQQIEYNMIDSVYTPPNKIDVQIERRDFVQYIDEDLSGAYKQEKEMGKIDTTHFIKEAYGNAAETGVVDVGKAKVPEIEYISEDLSAFYRPRTTGVVDVGKAKVPEIEYISEDLSAFYRPRTTKAKKLALDRWSNIYVQDEQQGQSNTSTRYTDNRQAFNTQNFKHRTRIEENKSGEIVYLDEDLSSMYKRRNNSYPNDEIDKKSSEIVYLDEDLSSVYKGQKVLSRRIPEYDETDHTKTNEILYLDEDLSNVYKSQKLKHPGFHNKGESSKADKTSEILYLDEDLSNVYKGQKIVDPRIPPRDDVENKKTSEIMYLDEDLSNVYKGQNASLPGRDDKRKISQIVYLDEDLSQVYKGQNATYPRIPRKDEVVKEKKSEILYLDEDLSGIYKGQNLAYPSITKKDEIDGDKGNKIMYLDQKVVDPRIPRKYDIDPDKKSEIKYLDEDLSKIYKAHHPKSSPKDEVDDKKTSEITYLDEDLSRVYKGQRTSYTRIPPKGETVKGETNEIEYLDEDLSRVYKEQKRVHPGFPSQGATNEDRTSEIIYLDEDLSNVYQTKKITHPRNLPRDDIDQRTSNEIIYLDEDLSRVYKGQRTNYTSIPPKEKTDKGEANEIVYLDEDLSNVYQSNKITYSRNPPRDDVDRRTSNEIMYLDEDLSRVYQGQNAAYPKIPQNHEKNEDETSGIVYLDEDLSRVYKEKNAVYSKIPQKDEKGEDKTSEIIYLNEDLSSFYKGQTVTPRNIPRNDEIKDSSISFNPYIRSQNQADQRERRVSNIEYIDEDLSSAYTENRTEGSASKPTLKAMVNYWEFSKSNAPRQSEEGISLQEAPKMEDTERSPASRYQTWEIDPSSNRMLSTLKWLDKQGINLDEIDVATPSHPADDKLEFSATELKANAAKAATLKQQDLAKTMDWLAKHGFTNKKQIAPIARSISMETEVLSSSPNIGFRETKKTVGNEVTKCQTKSDLAAALRWLQQHGYDNDESCTEINAPVDVESRALSKNDVISRNKVQSPTNMRPRRGGALYDENVLHTLSWLQKHGFDLDKSIHAERSRSQPSSKHGKVSSPSTTVVESEAPTMDSMIGALSKIDGEDDRHLVSSPSRKPKTKALSKKASAQEIDHALKWLAARGIGKVKKQSARSSVEAIIKSKEPNRFNSAPTSNISSSGNLNRTQIDDSGPKTDESTADQKKEKKKPSTNDMSSALRWLNRKGFAVNTAPEKKSAPKSPKKRRKSERNPMISPTPVSQKVFAPKELPIETTGSNTDPARINMDSGLRFFNVQDNRRVTPLPQVGLTTKVLPDPGKQSMSITKTKDNRTSGGSRRETKADDDQSNSESLSSVKKPKKSAIKGKGLGLKLSGSATEDVRPSSNSSKLHGKDSSEVKSKTVVNSLEEPSNDEKAIRDSSKTRSKPTGRRTNLSTPEEAKANRSKASDQKKEKSSSRRPSSNTADMEKTLKWLQTKASMKSPLKSPLKSPKPSARSSYTSKIPSLPPLENEDEPQSPQVQVPSSSDVKPSKSRGVLSTEIDFNNALDWLNNGDAKGLDDAVYFKKLDNMLPKRAEQSKEARAREMAKALAWVKKQGILDTGGAKRLSAISTIESNPASSKTEPSVVSNPKTAPEVVQEENIDRKVGKLETERKKLTSIKEMAKQVNERQKALEEKMANSAANQKKNKTVNSASSDPATEDFQNALNFVKTKQSGGDVMVIKDVMQFKKLDNMLPNRQNQAPEDRAREMVKMLGWLRKKGKA